MRKEEHREVVWRSRNGLQNMVRHITYVWVDGTRDNPAVYDHRVVVRLGVNGGESRVHQFNHHEEAVAFMDAVLAKYELDIAASVLLGET